MIDLHTHTKRHKPEAPILAEENVLSAIKKGLKTIYIGDHFTFPYPGLDSTTDGTDAFTENQYDYLSKKVEELKIKYKNKIEVIFGAEADYIEGYEKEIRERIKKYDLDYVIGSVHYLTKYYNTEEKREKYYAVDFDYEIWNKAKKYLGGTENLIKNYYDNLRKLVSSKLFDNCAHFDLVKIYNPNDKLFSTKSFFYKNIVMETLELISKNNMSIEINTSGILKDCKEFYPSLWILKEAQKLNIPITIGSDAHTPEGIGFMINEAIEYAKSAGYKEICKYVKRNRVFIKI